jgi:hypothetical protein
MIQKSIADNPLKRAHHIKLLTTIANAAKERKTHITKSLGQSLPSVHPSSPLTHDELVQTVLDYDGQTTNLTL